MGLQNTINLQPLLALPKEKVFEILETSEDGLSEREAEERLQTFGRNVLPKREKPTQFLIFLSQFKSPLILILVLAGITTLLLHDFKDAIFIFAAVAVNTALGFYQENKAETALTKLTSYIQERTRVIRDGQEKEIDAEEVVPGDIVKLISGSRVPADGRVIHINNLVLDESILTGESLPIENKSDRPVKEKAEIPDQTSMVFAGTLVAGGVGLAVATATSASTELGKIATLVQAREKELTPLQESISRFALRASLILGIFTVLLFFAGIAAGYDRFQMFLTSVAVAVAAVPEGLPIALTVILAVGVERLARRNGVVRKLLAAETLGSTTVILTDKTGTLTEGSIKLSEIIPLSDLSKEQLLELALLNTDVLIESLEGEPDAWRIIGQPLESALVRAAGEHRVLLSETKKKIQVLDRHPFNSRDKFAAAEIELDSKKVWNYLGAPEALLEKTKDDKSMKEAVLTRAAELAHRGSRVLGVATEDRFLGLLTFHDPVRGGVKRALHEVSEAGVKTVLVTGDHAGTAISVFKELGVAVTPHEVLVGREVKQLADEELLARLERIKIFARITPEEKLRLVTLYKRKGAVVAMIGDGVNDAPALKGADIGVSVGSGTDVAKGASDLVLLDNNFETMVRAISEGRRILENMKKVIVYLLSGSLDELFLIGGAIVSGLTLPLNALQILWVNFFSDSFPAVALAFEDGFDHLRGRPPKLKERLFDPQMRFLILVVGVASSAFLFLLYALLLELGFEEGLVKTFIFSAFGMYTLFLAFAIRSLSVSIFKYNPFSNHYLVYGVLIGFLLMLSAIYLPPLQSLLGTRSLPLPWLAGVVGVGILNIAGIEIGKLLFRKK